MNDSDVLIVGGGITGLSLAVHAAREGLLTTLVEMGELGGANTQRSGALVRTHYADRSSAQLALRGLCAFESFGDRYGGPAGFEATGFAYLPEDHDVSSGALAERVAMLRGCGIETDVVDHDAAAAIDPELQLDDVACAVHEPRSGYADPARTTSTLAMAARAAGARLHARRAVTELLTSGAAAAGEPAAVRGARLADGSVLRATTTVLCAGAWSRPLAASAGVEVPVRPTAVKLAFLHHAVTRHLTVIDAPGGLSFRPDPSGSTLVGRRTWSDEPMEHADAPLPVVDDDFVGDARNRLAARLPSARTATVTATRSGMLDMTPDGLPLVGPTVADGLWLCCGWSGTGFKTGPAVGEALAGWLASGVMDPDLAGFGPDRDMVTPAGVRSPH